MIMIIGSQHDDILYFESVITNKKEELIMGKFKVTIGTIFNQAVMLVDQVKTNYLSSALTLSSLTWSTSPRTTCLEITISNGFKSFE